MQDVGCLHYSPNRVNSTDPNNSSMVHEQGMGHVESNQPHGPADISMMSLLPQGSAAALLLSLGTNGDGAGPSDSDSVSTVALWGLQQSCWGEPQHP